MFFEKIETVETVHRTYWVRVDDIDNYSWREKVCDVFLNHRAGKPSRDDKLYGEEAVSEISNRSFGECIIRIGDRYLEESIEENISNYDNKAAVSHSFRRIVEDLTRDA